jgi:hypothetical protein
MEPKYKNITVKLVGEDGNAFAIMGMVRKSLLKGSVPPAEVSDIMKDLFDSSSYDSLLQKVLGLVNVK